MKILLIQFGAIGDVLMCTPAIEALRKHFPQAEISFLVSTKAKDALINNQNINKVLIVDLKMSFIRYIFFLMRFIFSRYDIVIDFQRNPRTAIITFLTQSQKRISFQGKHRNYAYNIKEIYPDVKKYAAINKLSLLKALNIEESDKIIPVMPIKEKDREFANKLWEKLKISKNDFVVSVSPVSIKSYRRWNLKYYAQVCDFLIEQYQAKLVFTWGPNEKQFVQQIKEMMQHEINIDYSISTILELKAIYEKSSLYFGNDNGPRHIAISANIPTVGVFSHLLASHWTPPGYKKHVVVSPLESGINNVQLDDVMKAVKYSIENFVKREA